MSVASLLKSEGSLWNMSRLFDRIGGRDQTKRWCDKRSMRKNVRETSWTVGLSSV